MCFVRWRQVVGSLGIHLNWKCNVIQVHNLLSKILKTKIFFQDVICTSKLAVNPDHAVVFQNVNNDVPVVHSLSDGKIGEMVLDNNNHEDSSDEDDDSKGN